LSNVVRHAITAPTIFIGEQQLDAQAETAAERKLARLFPRVQYVTAPTGAKLIPVLEVDELERVLADEKEAALTTGTEQGRTAGYEQGMVEARRVMQQFDQAIGDAVRARATMLEEAKQRILELVVRISRKVTCDAIEIDREKTAAMIAGIIDQLTDRSRLKILVHPDFLPVVEQNVQRYLSGQTLIRELTIEADSRVKVGGCFIQTPVGDIDARLESQFEVIEDVLMTGEGQS
jgi:flagellar biosynthesis/type III secretory pathway protein FliH